jgi:type IV secretion system protein VirB1
MTMAFAAALALARACAPRIAPEAMLSIVSVESGFDPLAINVNHVGRLHAGSAQDAAQLAGRWIAAGYSVDLGLAQINSRNLASTGLSVARAFEACANLGAAGQILEADYARAGRETVGIGAISRTFSLYNSGSTRTGFANHYVGAVWQAANQVLARMAGTSPAESTTIPPATEPGSIRSASFVVAPSDVSVLIFK